MQPSTSPPLAIAMPPEHGKTPWSYWSTVLGAVMVACGFVVPLIPLVFFYAGIPVAYGGVVGVETWYEAGALLDAFGFLAAFVGIVAALRVPAPVPRRATRMEFRVVLLGGLLVAAGASATAIGALYMAATFTYVTTAETALQVGGLAVEAVGFLVALLGIAHSLRGRV